LESLTFTFTKRMQAPHSHDIPVRQENKAGNFLGFYYSNADKITKTLQNAKFQNT